MECADQGLACSRSADGSIRLDLARSSSIICPTTLAIRIAAVRNLWFTVMGLDMIGKLVPTTGEIKLVRADHQCAPLWDRGELRGRSVLR
jgi:streptogramin lyase